MLPDNQKISYKLNISTTIITKETKTSKTVYNYFKIGNKEN